MTNIDFKDKGINANNLNNKFIEEFFIGHHGNPGTSAHAGKLSDVNVWDFPLSKSEMEAWTTCR